MYAAPLKDGPGGAAVRPQRFFVRCLASWLALSSSAVGLSASRKAPEGADWATKQGIVIDNDLFAASLISESLSEPLPAGDDFAHDISLLQGEGNNVNLGDGKRSGKKGDKRKTAAARARAAKAAARAKKAAARRKAKAAAERAAARRVKKVQKKAAQKAGREAKRRVQKAKKAAAKKFPGKAELINKEALRKTRMAYFTELDNNLRAMGPKVVAHVKEASHDSLPLLVKNIALVLEARSKALREAAPRLDAAEKQAANALTVAKKGR